MFVIKNLKNDKYYYEVGKERFIEWTSNIKEAKRFISPFEIINLLTKLGFDVTHVLLKEEGAN